MLFVNLAGVKILKFTVLFMKMLFSNVRIAERLKRRSSFQYKKNKNEWVVLSLVALEEVCVGKIIGFTY